MTRPTLEAVDKMTPTVSVIIATRDQRECVGRAVESVLANEAEEFDVCVIDSNTSGRCAESLEPLLGHPVLSYSKTSAVASTAAHNEAVALTQGELVAITDDDCEVSPTWIRSIGAAFALDSRIGVVFGNVLAAESDRRRGTNPTYIRDSAFLAREVRDQAQVEGIWASMAIRRTVWEELGGFDEVFGARARFPGSADSDFALRALAVGHFVYQTPEVSVRHHRVIQPDHRKQLAYRYSFASGALMAKHLKCRARSTPRIVATLAHRWLRGGSHTAISLGDSSYRGPRIAGFLRGFCAGVLTPVDRRTWRFRTDFSR